MRYQGTRREERGYGYYKGVGSGGGRGGLIRPNFKILLGAVFHFFPSSSVYSSTYTLVLLSSRFCSAAFPFDVEANDRAACTPIRDAFLHTRG